MYIIGVHERYTSATIVSAIQRFHCISKKCVCPNFYEKYVCDDAKDNDYYND